MTKIYSWNVNGIRAVQKKGLWQPFIDVEQPDILCLQEVKASETQAALDVGDYHIYWYAAEKPGYSGTAILSKQAPLQVVNGFPDDIVKQYDVTGDTFGDPNKEGRVIAAEFEKYWVVTVYTPNAKDDLGRLALRHKHWDPAFLAYCQQLEATGKAVVFCGDLNVAHTEMDLANPKSNIGKKASPMKSVRVLITSWLLDLAIHYVCLKRETDSIHGGVILRMLAQGTLAGG